MVLNTNDPTRPGNSAGVAFVLNKELTNTASAKMKTLIPGHAATLSLKWHNNENINILNVYAPNNTSEHPSFWEKVKTEWQRCDIGQIDLMAAPTHLDNERAIDALRDLRSALNMQDTWRMSYPQHRIFMFSSNHNTLSCLDRIFLSDKHTESLINWDSQICQIPTDHHMVTVRWSWPMGIISDDTLQKNIITLGIETQQKIIENEQRNEDANPQIIWEKFKDDMINLAKKNRKDPPRQNQPTYKATDKRPTENIEHQRY
ncbi:uncharacterized protein EDB91DRAFT_1240241 [Suillus paluster]|uniref:uncharacterized protein n=1 Tax=Suillus paluster TaxID=48578 RepID=UPI001B882D5D|nr:uncharacterized protein EDB91DRAFT_1240241 [Suillus paluster]KAG1722167.1 hypothetical protein EDB91DRAFT_1240241 [Suillus paluster]